MVSAASGTPSPRLRDTYPATPDAAEGTLWIPCGYMEFFNILIISFLNGAQWLRAKGTSVQETSVQGATLCVESICMVAGCLL